MVAGPAEGLLLCQPRAPPPCVDVSIVHPTASAWRSDGMGDDTLPNSESGSPPPWRDYRCTAKLLSDLSSLHNNPHTADLSLLAGAGRVPFPGHSSILAARCPALVPALGAFIAGDRDNVVAPLGARRVLDLPLPAIAPETLRLVLRYAYTGRVRLRSANVFGVLRASRELGMSRLAALARAHVRWGTDDAHALSYLTQALGLGDEGEAAVEIVDYVARRARVLVVRDEFCCLPRATVLYILKQEDLGVTEGVLWIALVKWACVHAGVAAFLKVSEMDDEERARVRDFLVPFVRPSYLRVLNMEVVTFAKEVEPLQLLSPDEVLLKYRYDATAETNLFDDAFPLGRLEFLSRVRQQSYSYASSHPHAQGYSEQFEVVLPSWTKMALITFDSRCKLGRYARLEFYENDACGEPITSLDDILAAHRVALRTDPSLPDEPSTNLPFRRFWFAMYAPSSFSPAWGYSFRVRPSIA